MIVLSVFIWIFAVIGFLFTVAFAVMWIKAALRVRKLKKLMCEGAFVSGMPHARDVRGERQ